MTGSLADLVHVRRRFRRSVRIGSDTAAEEVEGFVCTATAAQALRTTLEHVVEHGHGAFTWTGPYGCGKSTLAQVLAAALGAAGAGRDAALAALPRDLADDLTTRMRRSEPGWSVVPVVGRRVDASTAVAEALRAAGLPQGEPIAALRAAAEAGPGVLLLVDEMGKLLEHAASADGDAHFFQELAEAAARSGGRLVVVGVLHQAFDDYAYRLARETRDDWLKVQGRFVDVPLSPTPEEQLELLSRAIVADGRAPLAAAGVVAAAAARNEQAREGIEARLRDAWPLNPVSACLLGPLSRRRFGQNQRSTFGFLGSSEPFGFQDFLRSTPADAESLYDPVWLWNYLRSNLEPSILASPDGHRWSIAVDAVERMEACGSEEAELRVLKTVALLDLFRERSGLTASPPVIAAALSMDEAAVETALATLVRRSAVVHRRHLGAFALYAGSDFDVEAAVEAAAAETGGSDYSRLKSTGVLTPILAKREYHETGAMRWFDVDVAKLDEAETRIAALKPASGAAGLFLLLINDEAEGPARVRSRMERLADAVGDRPVAFGLSGDTYMIRELTRELVALERVQSSRPELKGDPVARREVASRIARLAGELEERLRSGFAAARWRVPAIGGEEFASSDGAAGLSVIASRLAARLYGSAPRIRNELLNRSKPSPNGVAAMRALMAAMVSRAGEARLGIRDFPAEGGLYASILERAGLHGGDGAGGHGFRPPVRDDAHRLHPLWKSASDLLEDAGPAGASMAELFSLWRSRPYGVKEGLLPVLGLAYLLTRREELSAYLDGAFCSNLGDLLVDRLLQDASAVRLRVTRVGERDAAILRGVGDLVAGLSGEPSRGGDLLAIGRQLVAIVVGAPGWTRRTSRLGVPALRVRDLATAAHDPTKFMLDDLPRIVGSDAPVDAVVDAVRSGLLELTAAYGNMLGSLRDLLLAELRVGDDDGVVRLRVRARAVCGVTGNYRLDAFATRLTAFDDGDEVMEGLASLAANKPPRDWVDRDVDAARAEFAALSRDFLRAEGLAHVQGRDLGRFSFAVYLSDPARPGLLTPEATVDGEGLRRARALAASLRAVVGDKVDRDVALAAAAELAALLVEEGDAPAMDAAA